MTKMCRIMADWCRKYGNVSEKEYPIVLYGLQVMFNSSLKMLGILLIGACLGVFREVVISMSVFCSMRYWAGGWHSSTHMGCFGSMLIPCLCPAFLQNLRGSWIYPVWLCMIVYSLYAIFRYAPRNSKVNPITDERILRRKRVVSILESTLLVVLIGLLGDESIRWLIVTPLFVEAVTLSAVLCGKE